MQTVKSAGEGNGPNFGNDRDGSPLDFLKNKKKSPGF